MLYDRFGRIIHESKSDYYSTVEAALDFFNGSFIESFDAFVSSNGTVVTMDIEQSGGGDLTMRFSDGFSTLDCTPAAEIELTVGTDAAPQANYIYVLQSTKALTKSTTTWPAGEHIKVAFFLVPSATFVQADGCYVNQNWNDHAKGTDEMGHMSHMAERSRRDGAYYFSGLGGAGTSTYLTIAASNVELKINAGIVYQMHKHTFPAFDTSSGDVVLVKNWDSDPYHSITDLFDIDEDSGGNSIGNNKWFNLVVWGVANKTGSYEPVIINLPSGFYNTQSDAENDVNGYDDFTIPREFAIDSSTGFLICRITVQMNATWSHGSTVDLRGTTPQSASGGSAGVDLSAYIPSSPLSTHYKVVNMYVNATSGKLVVDYDDTPTP